MIKILTFVCSSKIYKKFHDFGSMIIWWINRYLNEFTLFKARGDENVEIGKFKVSYKTELFMAYNNCAIEYYCAWSVCYK